MPIDIDSSAPNINKPYTVTDKADGDRKLLYIANDGKMYLIDTNMKVQFTGHYDINLAQTPLLMESMFVIKMATLLIYSCVLIFILKIKKILRAFLL